MALSREDRQKAVVRGLARHYRMPVGDVERALSLLPLPEKHFGVLFTNFIRLSKEFGMNPAELAEFISKRTSGIKQLRRNRDSPRPLTKQEWARVRELVPDGDWARAVLRLADTQKRARSSR